MKKVRLLVVIGTCACSVVIAVLLFVLNRSSNEIESVIYDGLNIECIQTDETVVAHQYSAGIVSVKTEYIVFECKGTDPDNGTTYPIDLEISAGADLYLHWVTCDRDGRILKASVEFNDSAHDIVFEETLECVEDPST